MCGFSRRTQVSSQYHTLYILSHKDDIFPICDVLCLAASAAAVGPSLPQACSVCCSCGICVLSWLVSSSSISMSTFPLGVSEMLSLFLWTGVARIWWYSPLVQSSGDFPPPQPLYCFVRNPHSSPTTLWSKIQSFPMVLCAIRIGLSSLILLIGADKLLFGNWKLSSDFHVANMWPTVFVANKLSDNRMRLGILKKKLSNIVTQYPLSVAALNLLHMENYLFNFSYGLPQWLRW